MLNVFELIFAEFGYSEENLKLGVRNPLVGGQAARKFAGSKLPENKAPLRAHSI